MFSFFLFPHQHPRKSHSITPRIIHSLSTSAQGKRGPIYVLRPFTMGVTVETQREGDKQTYPKKGDNVTMDYTGTLQDGTVRAPSIFLACSFVFRLMTQR